MRVTLVHNPTAGDEDHGADELVALVRREGHDVGYASSHDRAWKDAVAAGGDLVVAAGGDGTVGEVFKRLAGSPTVVTVLPLGTANNIARTLGLAAGEPEELIRRWGEAVLLSYDVGEIAGPSLSERFVESAGGGAFADVLERAPDDSVDADSKFESGLRTLRDVLAAARPSTWQLELDGLDLSGEFLGVEAMNIHEIGPAVPIAPSADPADGLLDVVLIGPEDRDALRKYVDARLAGDTPPRPDLTVHRGRELVFRPPPDRMLRVDDESRRIERSGGDGTFTVRAGVTQVTVLAPPSGAQTR